jgi:hypothetical protein
LDKVVYAVLACYSNEERTCYPRQSLLAQDVGCQRQTINARLWSLREAGRVEWRNTTAADVPSLAENSGRRLANDYRLLDRPLFKEGYGQVALAVLVDTELKIGPRALYALLTTYADRDGRHVQGKSRRLLAQQLGLKRVETISEWIGDLEHAGYLTRLTRTAQDLDCCEDSHRQMANDYVLQDAPLFPEPPPVVLTPMELECGISSNGAPVRGRRLDALADSMVEQYFTRCQEEDVRVLQSTAATRSVIRTLLLRWTEPCQLLPILLDVTLAKQPVTVEAVSRRSPDARAA